MSDTSTTYRRIFGVSNIPEDQPSPYTLDDNPDDIREALAMFNPALATAQMSVDDQGNIRFTSTAGNKG